MPKLIRLYITQVAIGFALAGVFVGMLLWFDIANLWHLVTHSDKGVLAVVVLWFANGIVFAGVQFAIAVMRMKDDEWQSVLEVNLTSTMRLCRGVMRGMWCWREAMGNGFSARPRGNVT